VGRGPCSNDLRGVVVVGHAENARIAKEEAMTLGEMMEDDNDEYY